MQQPTSPPVIQHVILLVHGIRTQAEWAEKIRDLLEDSTTEVKPVRYGFFHSLRFLLPFSWLKRRQVRIVRNEIRDVKQRYPEAKISILAHSFSSHLTGRVLEEEADIRLHSLVLCGSVLRRDYPWRHVAPRIGTIVNDCGWRDIWPVIAESITWGYGSSGRSGFTGSSVHVRDRFHDRAHSDFLQIDFARKYWLPLFKNDHVVASDASKRPTTPLLVSLLGVFRLRYLLVLLLIASGLLLARLSGTWPRPEEETARGTASLTSAPKSEVNRAELFPSDRLEWSKPEAPQGQSVSGYEVRLGESPELEAAASYDVGNRPFIQPDKLGALIGRLAPNTNPVYWAVRAKLKPKGHSAWSETQPLHRYSGVLDRISQRLKLRIGVSQSQEDLFSCRDLAGNWKGIDIEVARRLLPALGEALGIEIDTELEIETFPWGRSEGEESTETTLFEAASRRRVNFVISSVTSKPSREEKYGIRFTVPYFHARQAIVSAPSHPITSISALRGRKIGAQDATTNWEYARHLGTTVSAYRGNDSMSDMIRDLEDGQIDAFFLDEPFALMRNRGRARNGQAQLHIAPLEPETLAADGFPEPHSEDYAIVLHKSERLLKSILDNEISRLEEAGFLATLAEESRSGSPCLGT